jgi:transposase
VSYKAQPPIARKLEPYRGIIHAHLQDFPLLTAERIFETIQASGYTGGYTQIKEHVRQIRLRPIEEAVRRFDTPAGFQVQVDYAIFNLPCGRRYAPVVVLGYSRLLWLRFFPRQIMQALFRGLESASTSALCEQSVKIKPKCFQQPAAWRALQMASRSTNRQHRFTQYSR